MTDVENTDTSTSEPIDDPTGTERPGNEASRYRRRLRAPETERDALLDQLAAAQGRISAFELAIVNELAGAVLTDADDLTKLGGLNTDELPRDEAGEMDRVPCSQPSTSWRQPARS